MQSRPVTTRDIAEAAGVNQSTVSRALRNDASVSSAMQQRIRALADEMGYRPNPFVSAFTAQVRGYRRSPQHASIALLNAYHSDRRMPFVARYAEGATRRAEQLGFKVDYFDFQQLECRTRRLLQILNSRGIRGLLILPLPVDVNLADLEVDHLACATVDLSDNLPPISHALPDYFRHTQTAARRLEQYGLKRIGFCTKQSELKGFARYHVASYLEWQQHLPPEARLAIHVDEVPDGRLQGNRDAFLQWVERECPDAVISNDVRFYQWMISAGIDVPGEIGFATLTREDGNVNLAGIDQQQARVGAAAMDLVVGHIYRNEYGVPETHATVFIDGLWRDGASVRKRTAD